MNQSSEHNHSEKTPDPFEAWRSVRDSAMDMWAKTMVQAVNTDAYAQTTGSLLDAYLAAMGPFREIFEKTMAQTVQQFGMPTRADIISLAERLTNIEMRLDDIDAKFDAAIGRQRAAAQAEAKPHQPRPKEGK